MKRATSLIRKMMPRRHNRGWRRRWSSCLEKMRSLKMMSELIGKICIRLQPIPALTREH
jgi:hypothetical protein